MSEETIKSSSAKDQKIKYAFLDRDGTVIHEPQDSFQVDSLEKLVILDGVIHDLKLLIDRGYKLIMVTNQNGIGTPSYPQEDFDVPHQKMIEIFAEDGIVFEEIFICPHLPTIGCNCRKPKTGLVDNFLLENKDKIDYEYSFFSGDRLTDNELATKTGLKFISIETNGDFMTVVENFPE